MTALADLGTEEFVLLTTFRRSGEPVPTAVWIAPSLDEPGVLLVTTTARSGKVMRLRNDPRVILRPCGRHGEVEPDAPSVSATAELIDDPADVRRLREMIRAKYGDRMKVTAADRGELDPDESARTILRITKR